MDETVLRDFFWSEDNFDKPVFAKMLQTVLVETRYKKKIILIWIKKIFFSLSQYRKREKNFICIPLRLKIG